MSAPNLFRSSKWEIHFSNIPSITNMSDMVYFDQYVKNINIPSESLDLIQTNFKNFAINQPISRANVNLEQITIDFKVSEGLTNYYNFYTFIKSMRYGQNITEELIRLNIVKTIDLNILDNEKHPTNRLTFTNAFLVNLGSLNLVYGQDQEVTFTTAWQYEELKFINI
jgi:hypothetical protein